MRYYHPSVIHPLVGSIFPGVCCPGWNCPSQWSLTLRGLGFNRPFVFLTHFVQIFFCFFFSVFLSHFDTLFLHFPVQIITSYAYIFSDSHCQRIHFLHILYAPGTRIQSKSNSFTSRCSAIALKRFRISISRGGNTVQRMPSVYKFVCKQHHVVRIRV